MSIVIVEPDRPVSEQLIAWLEEEGFRGIIRVQTGAGLMALLGIPDPTTAKVPVDLIVLGPQLGDLSCLDLCQQLRSHHGTTDLPIIVLMGPDHASFLHAVYRVGSTEVLRPPFQQWEFLIRVRTALRLKYEIDRRLIHERNLQEVTRQMEESSRILVQLSSLDPLTAIPNWQRVDDILGHEWRRAMRGGVPLSLILMEIDAFPAYREHYGIPASNECLKNVAQALARPLRRPGDLLARFSGEQFVVILSNTTAEGARHIAEQLQDAVKDLKIPHHTTAGFEYVTMSLGVATLIPMREIAETELVAAAERALTHAKQEGANRIQIGQLEWIAPVADPSVERVLNEE